MDALSAEQAFRRGDLDRAKAICEQVLLESPNDGVALRVSGMIEVRAGRNEAAIPLFRKALESAKDDFLCLEWLQGALMKVGQFAHAVEIGERARALRPGDANILIGLSQARLQTGNVDGAIELLEKARSLTPPTASVCRLLGIAYERAKRNREALTQYREAIRLKPTDTEMYDRAIRILLEEGRFAAALKLADQESAANPTHGLAYLWATQALGNLGRQSEALTRLRKAVETDPDLAASAATWMQSYGHSIEAQQILEHSVHTRPVQGRAYYGLIKARTVTSEDAPLIAKLEGISETNDLSLRERLALLRALGKAADDLGKYDLAMTRFEEAARIANRLFSGSAPFDPRRLDAARESLFALLDRRFLRKYEHLATSGQSPIFVLGMIRSGTTLVQQILTSHPEVGDAGELPYWTTAFPSIVNLDSVTLREEPFVRARAEYTEVLHRFDSKSTFVSNKWPMNYAFVPILRLAYPNAKIIHVSRNPIDTALSIYMSDLGEPPPEFSYNKDNIVSVYRDYQARMDRWDAVMPAESIFSIRYEDLVADHEHWTRRLIQHCGLPWDDRCLEFYAGNRLVNTPSMLQVRKPIYASSIGKWRNYEPWLGPLASLGKAP